MRSVPDSLVVCFFAGRAITKDWIVKLINYVTDFDWKVEDIDTIGAKIYSLKRLLATREGITMKDDLLPHRIIEEPLTGGQSKGTKITQKNMEIMLHEYYIGIKTGFHHLRLYSCQIATEVLLFCNTSAITCSSDTP